MKVLFIEARKKSEEFDFEALKNLPKEIHLLYTIQYKNLAEKIKEKLEKRGFKILAFQQVTGCSKIKPKTSLLLIGSGRFHALQLALSTGKEVFIFDSGLNKIGKEEIEQYKKKEQGKKARFLSSKNIGLLVSTKPGQNKIKEAVKLKQELKKKYRNKNFHIFISNTINKEDFENFQVDFWLNMACPGLELENSHILNYKK